MRTKESQRKINSLILLTLCTATLLITATYAWFTSQKDITVQNLTGKVNVTEGLQISLDGNSWSQTIDLAAAIADGTFAAPSGYSSAVNVTPTELLPVSYTGEVTSGLTKMPMYRIQLNADGTISSATNQSADTETASGGYVAFDLFVKDTSQGSYETSTLQLRADASAGLKSNEDGNYVYTAGTENTIRVAFCRYGTTVEYSANQTTVLNALAYGGTATIDAISIWEPNSTNHVQTIVDQNNKLHLTNTTAYDSFGLTDYAQTYALRAAILTGYDSVTDIYDWTTSGANVTGNKMGRQWTTQTTHAALAEGQTTVDYSIGTATTLKEATSALSNFTIGANKISKIRVYAWMEGQDVDCTDLASGGLGFDINLALTKEAHAVVSGS